MKDSNTDWLQDIPDSWEVTNIGSLYDVRNEKVSDSEYMPLSVTMRGVVPQLSTAAKTDAHDDRKLVRKGDFAINSRSDRRGSCGISDFEGSVSLINIIMAPRRYMNPKYYNWLFHTASFADEFYRWGHGIVDDLWTTRWQEMKNILVTVPSTEEQKEISDYLDEETSKIDQLLDNQKKQIENLKAYKQSLVTEVVTKGLLSNSEMKDSGVEYIGEMPQNWTVMKAKAISKRIVVGVVIKPADYFSEEGTVPFLRGMNVKEYSCNPKEEELVYITEEANFELSKSIVHTGDILIVRDGNIGISCVVPDKFDGANVVSMIEMTVNDENDPKFICYVLNSFVGKHQFDLTKIGSALTHTSVSTVSNIQLVIPPLAEQKSIVGYLDEKCSCLDRLIDIKSRKIEMLIQYKNSLIYEYVTGKKHV